MATFLDLGLLQHFAIIFPFLLVFVVTYAILTKFKVISEETSINALIAFAFAAMTLFSKPANALIITASPWFVVMFMFILFLILGFRLLGVRDTQIQHVMEMEFGAPHWIVIVIVALILIGSIGVVLGPGLLEDRFDASTPSITSNDAGSAAASAASKDTGNGASAGTGTQGPQFQKNVTDVLFHPKVIGFASLMLIVVFAIRTLMWVPPSSSGGGKEE